LALRVNVAPVSVESCRTRAEGDGARGCLCLTSDAGCISSDVDPKAFSALPMLRA
jgi:hypothetical protein